MQNTPRLTVTICQRQFEKRHRGLAAAAGLGVVLCNLRRTLPGWNFGIGAGRWGGFAIAAVLTWRSCISPLVLSLAEMSAAIPWLPGGGYSFAVGNGPHRRLT